MSLYLSILVALSLFSSSLTAASAASQAETNQGTVLNLQYLVGSDYTLGQAYSEEDLIEMFLKHPQTESLDLSGQMVSSDLMAAINSYLPELKELKIKGYTRFHEGEGKLYSWHSVNWQQLSPEAMGALFQEGSPLEVLDVSLSDLDDEGLKSIGEGAVNLKELYLKGARSVTDAGLIALVEKAAHLQLIDLGSVVLKEGMQGKRTLSPTISDGLIQQLLEKGIVVIR